jgi:hypothetical protein
MFALSLYLYIYCILTVIVSSNNNKVCVIQFGNHYHPLYFPEAKNQYAHNNKFASC